jgi:dCMP deaminase
MAVSTTDRRLLLQCLQVRENSHDPNRKVGVVIADDSGQVLAVGTNAPPSSLQLTIADSHEAIRNDPTWKYFVLEHAERNAIFAVHAHGKSVVGATMYSTLFPCADCARAIVAAGLSRLVVLRITTDAIRDAKWLSHYKHADRMLVMAGVAVELVELEDQRGDFGRVT